MRKILDTITCLEMFIAMVGVIVLTACLFLGAVSRTLGHPLQWTGDIGMLMLAWSTFLGGDVAFKVGRLSNLNLLLVKFPIKTQKIIAIILYIIIFSFLVFIIMKGIGLTYTSRFRTFQGVRNFSYSWAIAAMPVSAFFMSLTTIYRAMNIAKSNSVEFISKM